MQRSFIDLLFDLIGRVFFSHQQDWQRRRNAKIMTGAIAAGIFLGLVLVWVMKHLNNIPK
jgi:hypothetical protein